MYKKRVIAVGVTLRGGEHEEEEYFMVCVHYPLGDTPMNQKRLAS